MSIEDRVSHKKYGIGTVKRLYPDKDAAYVVYDSGHKTVNAQKRLTIVTGAAAAVSAPSVTISAPVPSPGTGDTKVRRRGKGVSTATVDYKLLDRAKTHFSDLFPDAVRIEPKIYSGRPYCEVWSSAGAQIHFYEDTKV